MAAESGRIGQPGVDQSRLSDPRLALDKHRPASAGRDVAHQRPQPVEFAVPAEKCSLSASRSPRSPTLVHSARGSVSRVTSVTRRASSAAADLGQSTVSFPQASDESGHAGNESAMKPGFRHQGCIYASDAEFLAMAVSFAQDGLGRGEPVLVATPAANLKLLR